ncbi:hypothetical protein ACBJ59_12135 [Nonomuraea sp. MTCD27]|uniref:hypothetical protein n=1 Tax=Nonomuraea sp. MTCD27 TaxID=1676747 RepID=UPI0035C1F3E4
MAWDPERDGPFGEYVKAKNIQVRPAGFTYVTRDQVTTGRRADGVAVKHTVDQLGHETTEHADGRRDVTINLPV